MTQHEVTVYKCDHCRKHYLVRHACEKHEKYCPKNPNNWHACFSCPHLEIGSEKIEGGYDDYRVFKTFTCKKLDKALHSFVAERIGHSCIGDTERMPLHCNDHPDTIEKAREVACALKGEKYIPDLNTVNFEFKF